MAGSEHHSRRGPIMSSDKTWADDDARIGVPTAERAQGFTAPHRREGDTVAELRPGETELGRPPQVPADLSPLSPEASRNSNCSTTSRPARHHAEAELLLAADPTGLGWLGWFGSPLIFAFLLGMAGVFGIFFFNQTFALVATLRAPEWAQYVGFAGWACSRSACCTRSSGSCSSTSACREPATAHPRDRGTVAPARGCATLAAARPPDPRQVEQYLNTYPMNTEKDRKRLRGLEAD